MATSPACPQCSQIYGHKYISYSILSIFGMRIYRPPHIHPKYQHFEILSDSEKINIVMSSVFVKHAAEYLYNAYYKRPSLIYN